MLRKTKLNGFMAPACLASIIIGTGNVHAFGALDAGTMTKATTMTTTTNSVVLTTTYRMH